LRTVIRQDYADADDIDVKLTCTGLQMLESPVKTVTAKRAIPLPDPVALQRAGEG
jgi:hypothetical protein